MTNQALTVRDGASQERALSAATEDMSPREIVAVAAERATVLMEIVEAKGLYAMIGGRKHLEAEAWEIILAFDNAYPVPEWSREMKDAAGLTIGYVSRVAIYKNGQVIAAGEMPCGFEEFPCRGKEGIAKHRAASSASQTWALAKAARMKYAWVAVMAGYAPTPAAEMYGADTTISAVALCPVHKVPFQHREGTSKAGKPYDFWACPGKTPSGGYCQEKPQDAGPDRTDAPPPRPQPTGQAQQRPANTQAPPAAKRPNGATVAQTAGISDPAPDPLVEEDRCPEHGPVTWTQSRDRSDYLHKHGDRWCRLSEQRSLLAAKVAHATDPDGAEEKRAELDEEAAHQAADAEEEARP